MDEIDLFESRVNAFSYFIQKNNIKKEVIDLYISFFKDLLPKKDITQLCKTLSEKIKQAPAVPLGMEIGHINDWVTDRANR